MLSTQISYWGNRENARHNLETEKQNLIDLERKRDEYNLNIKSLEETIRHNMQNESISREQAAAAIKQAEAAKAQAAASVKRASADIKLAKANIALAGARTQQTKAATTLTAAQTKEVRSVTKLNKANTKLKKQESKFYGLTNVAIPLVNSATKAVGALR